MKALVGAFNQEKALVGAFSVIVKTSCGTDGSFYSTSCEWQRSAGTSAVTSGWRCSAGTSRGEQPGLGSSSAAHHNWIAAPPAPVDAVCAMGRQ